MSKRLSLYVRGLQHDGVDARIVAVHREAGSVLTAYSNPFLIPFQAKAQYHAVLSESDIILVGGFDWFTYFLLGIWYGDGKRKLLYELNEKPGTVYTSRLLELKPIKALGMLLTKWSMKYFDGFVVISEPLRHYISGQMKASAKIVRLPIIIDVQEPFEELPAEIPPYPYIIHSGALSQQKDGIIDLFKAFAMLVLSKKNRQSIDKYGLIFMCIFFVNKLLTVIKILCLYQKLLSNRQLFSQIVHLKLRQLLCDRMNEKGTFCDEFQ
jgi:hypothetical protein